MVELYREGSAPAACAAGLVIDLYAFDVLFFYTQSIIPSGVSEGGGDLFEQQRERTRSRGFVFILK